MSAHCRLTMKGFTLIELLIVISLGAIIMALAIPNFSGTIRSNRLTTSANNLLAALNLARSEAVKRGRDVVVRKKNGGNWENGWVVFIDINRSTSTTENVFNDDGDATLCESGEDCLLREFPALPANFTLRGGNNLADFIRFTPNGLSNYLPDGLSNIGNDYFMLCDNSDGDGVAEANSARAIAVNSVGRPRLAQDTNNDGIPNLTSGTTGNVTDCTP